jgi:hypothetical protein
LDTGSECDGIRGTDGHRASRFRRRRLPTCGTRSSNSLDEPPHCTAIDRTSPETQPHPAWVGPLLSSLHRSQRHPVKSGLVCRRPTLAMDAQEVPEGPRTLLRHRRPSCIRRTRRVWQEDGCEQFQMSLLKVERYKRGGCNILTSPRLLESRMHSERCMSGSARGRAKPLVARPEWRACPTQTPIFRWHGVSVIMPN